MHCSSLADLERRMASISLPDCSEAVLSELVRDLQRGRRLIDGHLARVAAEATRREDAGSGPAAGHLFRGRGDVSRGEAERQVGRGRLSNDFPDTADKMHRGDTLTENMDTLARLTGHLGLADRARLAALDTRIADHAVALPPEAFTRWLRTLIRSVLDDDQPSDTERQRAASKLSLGRRQDGRWWLSGTFDGERGAELNAVIVRLARTLAGAATPTDNTRADALHRLVTARAAPPPAAEPTEAASAERSSSASTTKPTGDEATGADWLGPPAKLGIGYLIDAKTLADGDHADSVAQTWAGDDHDSRAIRRLACDADWYGVNVGDLGMPDAVGPTRRRASLEQRLALRALYRCCPLDGSPFDRCDIHHVNVSFGDGGPTELANLVPISTAWHHRVHDRGWSLTMAADRSLTLRRPDGTLDRMTPPPRPLTRRRE